jgi:hypothetical protein
LTRRTAEIEGRDFYANPYLFHDALQQCGLLRRILENLTPGG